MNVERIQSEQNDTSKVEQLFCDFLSTEEYNEEEVKMILRGWIRKQRPSDEILEWAKHISKLVLEFYHRCWTKRNLIKFGNDREARWRIQKDILLEKIHMAYDRKSKYFFCNCGLYSFIRALKFRSLSMLFSKGSDFATCSDAALVERSVTVETVC